MKKFINKNKPNKYKAVKTVVDGIKFDSKAEALYYQLYKHDKGMKMQEKFVLMDKFKLNGKTYREIAYKPDFTFYDNQEEFMAIYPSIVLKVIGNIYENADLPEEK